MKGRYLLFILLPLLIAAWGLELRRAARLVQASQILAAVETRSQMLGNLPAAGRGPVIRENIELLRRAAELDPARMEVFFLRAGQHVLLGERRSAKRFYHLALEIEPRAEVYLNLGQVLWEDGERDEAREMFRRALALDPRQRDAVRKYLPPGKATGGKGR